MVRTRGMSKNTRINREAKDIGKSENRPQFGIESINKFSLPYVVNTEPLRGDREREGRKEKKRKRENK